MTTVFSGLLSVEALAKNSIIKDLQKSLNKTSAIQDVFTKRIKELNKQLKELETVKDIASKTFQKTKIFFHIANLYHGISQFNFAANYYRFADLQSTTLIIYPLEATKELQKNIDRKKTLLTKQPILFFSICF